MRSGGTKKRLRLKGKLNMTESDGIQDKWIRSDFLPHIEKILQTPRLKGCLICNNSSNRTLTYLLRGSYWVLVDDDLGL